MSHTYVVGTIDKTNIDGTADINNENSDKTKGKCKLYVGSQSLGCHRDHMEVTYTSEYVFARLVRL